MPLHNLWRPARQAAQLLRDIALAAALRGRLALPATMQLGIARLSLPPSFAGGRFHAVQDLDSASVTVQLSSTAGATVTTLTSCAPSRASSCHLAKKASGAETLHGSRNLWHPYGSSSVVSGCAAGEYGECSAMDNGDFYTCEKGVCISCPAGKFGSGKAELVV